MKTSKDTLGYRLKTSRKDAGYTQKEAADKIGITQASISDLETGETQGTKHIILFSRLYKVNPVWLSEGTGDPKNTTQSISDQAKGYLDSLESLRPDLVPVALAQIKALLSAGK